MTLETPPPNSSFAFEIAKKDEYILAVTNGTLTSDGIRKLRTAIHETVRECGVTNILIDHRGITPLPDGFDPAAAISNSVTKLYEKKRKTRNALVMSKENYGAGLIWEAIIPNTTTIFRTFLSVDEARQWLDND